MARTRKGALLTEAHRLLQVNLGEQLGRALQRMFRKLIDYEDIDRSSVRFAHEAAPVVKEFRGASRQASINYLLDFQGAEAPDLSDEDLIGEGDFDDFDDHVDVDEILEELGSTTRSVMKASVKRGDSKSTTVARGEVAAVARARTLVADGGRDALLKAVEMGKGPIGYCRVVDADPCPFCAMLASRGAVYRSDAFVGGARFTGDGKFKVHDGCDCGLEPVYAGKGKLNLPGRAEQYAREWAEIASGRENPEAVWRRWIVSGTLPEDYEGDLVGKKRKSKRAGEGKVGKTAKPKKQKRKTRQDDWTAEQFREEAEKLRVRLAGVEAELDAFAQRGQGKKDVPWLALEQQRKQLVSRIDSFEERAAVI